MKIYRLANAFGQDDYMNIGSTPPEEDCAQVGAEDYRERTRAETNRYIEVLRQKLGREPIGARLAVKGFQHDFGTYYEVVCYYNEDFPDSLNYALACEGYGPKTWDDTAPVNIQELFARMNARREEDIDNEPNEPTEPDGMSLEQQQDIHDNFVAGVPKYVSRDPNSNKG